jgi:hypothetical protein
VPPTARPSGGAARFVVDYLTAHGGSAPSADVMVAAAAAGYSKTQVSDARRRCTSTVIDSINDGRGGRTWRIATADSSP